jgi:hypothetical protein
MSKNEMNKFLVSNFHRVVNIVFVLFLVIPRCLNFMFQSFGTLCSIFIGRLNKKNLIVETTYSDRAEWAETSAHKTQTSGNHPKELIQD